MSRRTQKWSEPFEDGETGKGKMGAQPSDDCPAGPRSPLRALCVNGCERDPRGPRRLRAAAVLAMLSALLVAGLVTSGPALALSQRGHAFSFAFGEGGVGKGQFARPMGIAVNTGSEEALAGRVYVADSRNNRVQAFAPVYKEGRLVGQKALGSAQGGELPVKYPISVAVDSSTSPSDPSKGDIYVVGTTSEEAEDPEPEELVVYKFNPAGGLVAKLKKFKAPGGEAEELEELQAVAVDGQGNLFVYEAEELIYEYNNAEKNEGVREIESSASEGRPALALDSEGDLYVGEEEFTPGFEEDEEQAEAEEELVEQITEEDEADGAIGRGKFSLVAELDPATGHVKVPAFDFEHTPAVAVNTNPVSEPSELDDVYLANVTSIGGETSSTVAAFSPAGPSNPHGKLIQRFGAPGLKEAAGLAVIPASGTVYVTDVKANRVDVFQLEGTSAPGVSDLFACTLETGTEGGCPQLPGNVALKAQVDPHGADTHYHFEYGPASCSSSVCTTTPEVDVGDGWADQGAGAEIENLPTGVYHYRVVATNELGTVRSAEGSFTIHAATEGLPDGRAWEMVSPTEKTGASPEAIPTEGNIQAAAGGDAIAYIGRGVMPSNVEPEGNRNPEWTQVLSTRASDGWSSQDLVTPNLFGEGVHVGTPAEYELFSPNLALALVHPYEGAPGSGALANPPLSPPLPGEEAGKQEKTIYLRSDGPRDVLQPQASELASYEKARANGEVMHNPGFLALVTQLNAPGGEPFGGGEGEGIEIAGANSDLSHVVIAAHRTAPGLYEWGPDETLEPVSVLPGETAATNVHLGNSTGTNAVNAVSSDGSRVFWSAGVGAVHLYVRDTVTHETLQLDSVQPGASGLGEAKAVYQGASADGSRVFFTEAARLTPDSKAGHFTESLPDLYVAQLSGGNAPGNPLSYTLKDLTPEGKSGESGAVLVSSNKAGGVLGLSRDGTHIYFAANGALAPGAERGHCAVSEEPRPPGTTCSVYERVFRHGEWTPTKLIAGLSPADGPSFLGGPKVGDLAEVTARVSPSGEYLAFMSSRSLTGYNNEDVTSKSPGERMDEEVFLYDEARERIVCVSCNPDGSRPRGVLDSKVSNKDGSGLVVDRQGIWSAELEGEFAHWLAGSIPGWIPLTLTSALHQSRYLNDEGRLFFNSPSDLVPASATPKEKVYGYEPQGVGSCTAAGGCVSLLSSPTAEHESAFLDASESGNDVFFLTAEKLVQQDPDDAFDVYDARVCGAAGCLQPPQAGSPPCASTEECRPGAASTPIFSAPASTSVGVSGNVSQVRVLASKETPKPKKKTLTRAQKLKKALKSCRKKHKHNKHKRASCERSARKKYGPVHKASKKHKKSSSKGKKKK